jgi:hypothetical protein
MDIHLNRFVGVSLFPGMFKYMKWVILSLRWTPHQTFHASPEGWLGTLGWNTQKMSLLHGRNPPQTDVPSGGNTESKTI